MIHHYCKEVSIHSSFVRMRLKMHLPNKAYEIIEHDQDNIQLCINILHLTHDTDRKQIINIE